jgi:predicted RNase H-like nuclease
LEAHAAPLRSNELLESLLSQDPMALRGHSRKSYEDSLDAVFCAYLAYYAWRLGETCFEVFGSEEDGYILNPRLRSSSLAMPAT